MHNFKLFFPISISAQTICAIPSPEYVLSIRPLRSSSRQWNTILLFIGDQIFIDQYTEQFLQSYCCSIDFSQIFHIDNGFFYTFYSQIVRLSFLRSFLIYLFDGKLQYLLYLIHLHQSQLNFNYFLLRS